MILVRLAIALFAPFQWLGVPPVAESDMVKLNDQGFCVEYIDEAMAAGWPSHDLPRLMRIMHRESRCIPTACSVPDRPDQRRCRDWGLMQINDYSWKGTVRRMGFKMNDMHDPLVNLIFARYLFEIAEDSSGCGWSPWNGKC